MGQIFFLEFLKILGGAANAGFGALLNLLKSGFSTAVKFHQEGIAFAREMGMSAKEAQAYTEVLTQRTENLASKYGVAAEKVVELQKNISTATSRQLMLNDAQAEQFLQINKLVGSTAVNKFTEELMNGMGGNVESVTGAVSKAYTLASKSGLHAQKISEKIANNLSLANKLSFRTGIDGLTRMAIQAEKVGMNLQSMGTIADKFMDFESAIESSAQLSMLGGAAGAIGGNPLDMMYEANYDPEELQKRIPKMLSGLAQFDAEKGVSHLNGFAQDMARNIGKSLGIDPTEAVNVAKRVAANKYKEEHIDPRLRNMGLSQEQIDFLINKSDVKNGQVSLTTANNDTIDLGAVSKNSEEMKKLVDEMMKYDNMSEKDIMEQNAQTLTSINEQLSGIAASISAMFSGFLNGLLPGITKDIKDYGAWAKTKLEPLAKQMGTTVREIYTSAKNWIPEIKTAASGLIGFMKFVTEHWKAALAALLAIKAAKYIGGISLGAGSGTVGQKAAGKIFGGIKNLGANIWSASKGMSPLETRYDYNYLRHPMGGGNGRFMAAVKAPFRTFGRLSGAGKALVGGGAALGVGLGAYNAITADNAEDRGAGIGTAVGTALGAVVGGPIGAAIGGFLGDFAGRFVGEHWGDITGAISNAWDGMVSWFKDSWGTILKYWDDMSKWISDKWHKISEVFGLAVDGFKKFISDPLGSIKNAARGAVNGIKEFFGFSEGGIVPGTGTEDTVPAMLTPGEYVVPKNKVGEMVKAMPVGGREYIYIPQNTSTSTVGDNKITINDINVRVEGTIKLDAGNAQKDIDISKLLDNHMFVSMLADKINTAINSNINLKEMRDTSYLTGRGVSSTIVGRMMTTT
jgi:hypothetical protein